MRLTDVEVAEKLWDNALRIEIDFEGFTDKTQFIIAIKEAMRLQREACAEQFKNNLLSMSFDEKYVNILSAEV